MVAASLGQIAYNGFGEEQAWIRDGTLMPSWDSVPVAEKMGWEASAKAVAKAITQARHRVEMQALDASEEPHGER